jgi:transcriptional regulator with XRE-family HTH domain
MTDKPKPAADAEGLRLLADTTAGPAERRLEFYVGAAIRRRRKRMDLTVSELAGRAGLSQGMLSKIETGQATPSLSTLSSLATELDVPLATFFTGFDDSRDASYVPKDRGIEIDRRGTRRGHVYHLLGHGVGGRIGFEPYLITLTEDSEPFTQFRHDGIEFLYMLEGEIEYRHGERSYRLAPGDSLYFDSIAPHGPETLIRLPARYLAVMAYPRSEE